MNNKNQIDGRLVPAPPSWTTTIYDYVYDNKGNWIKKTTSTQGKIERVVTRDIEYF